MVPAVLGGGRLAVGDGVIAIGNPLGLTRTTTQVATMTGGRYFQAKDAKELNKALMHLPDSIVLQRKHVELTVWFALAGALLVLAAVGLSQWWNRPSPVPVPAGP